MKYSLKALLLIGALFVSQTATFAETNIDVTEVAATSAPAAPSSNQKNRKLARILLKIALRGTLGYVTAERKSENLPALLTTKSSNKTLKYDLADYLDAVIDWAIDEYLELNEKSNCHDALEWLLPRITNKCAGMVVQGKFDQQNITDKSIAIALEAISKKKLFLSKDNDLRKAIDLPIIMLPLAGLSKGETGTYGVSNDILKEIAVGVFSESMIEKGLIPQLIESLGEDHAFVIWLNGKACRKDLIKSLLASFMAQSLLTGLAKNEVAPAPLP